MDVGWLWYLEVEVDEGEDQRLEVLHKVVEDTEAFRVRRFLNVLEGTDLCRLNMVSKHAMKVDCAFPRAYFKRDVLVTKPNLQLLTPVLVLLWPFGVVFPMLLSEDVISYRKKPTSRFRCA